MTQDNDQNPQDPNSDSQPESSPPVPPDSTPTGEPSPPPESSPPPVTTTASSKVDLPIMDLIGEAWNIYKNNVLLLLGGIVVIFIVVFGANAITRGALGIVVGGPLSLGYVMVIMKIIKGENAEFGNLFDGFKMFLPAFVANLLITIFVAVGLVLCVIPGILVKVVYMLTFFYMSEKGLDFWPSMEASRERVMGDLKSWLLLFLSIIVLNILGAMACGVGLLVTCPMSYVIIGLAYRRTEGDSAASATVS